MKTLAALSLLALSAPAFAQAYYPILCRAGADIKVSSTRSLTVLEVNSASLRAVDEIRFKRGAVAAGAGGAGLQPGTCAWQDRGVSPNEPALITSQSTSASAMVFTYRTGEPNSFMPADIAYIDSTVYTNRIYKGWVRSSAGYLQVDPARTIRFFTILP